MEQVHIRNSFYKKKKKSVKDRKGSLLSNFISRQTVKTRSEVTDELTLVANMAFNSREGNDPRRQKWSTAVICIFVFDLTQSDNSSEKTDCATAIRLKLINGPSSLLALLTPNTVRKS